MKSFPIIAGLSGLIFVTGILFVVSCSSRNTGAQNTSSEIQKNQNSLEAAKDSVESKTIDSMTQLYKDTSHHFVFLTWDDAPQSPGTGNCRKVFKELGVKASFFAVGFNMLNKDREQLVDSIRRDYPALLLVNGWDTEWRGNGNTQLPRESATEMANRVLAQLSSGKTRIPGAVVVLSHDRYFTHADSVDSLRTFIQLLQADPRIHFETIDHFSELHLIRRPKISINQEN